MEQKKSNATLFIVLAILSVVALVVAWSAFNRSGDDLAPAVVEESRETAEVVEREAEEASEEITREADEWERSAEIAAARAEARAELLALEARVEAGETAAEIESELEQIQTDLAAAYADTSVQAQQEWQNVEQEFADFEASVRDGTADTLSFLAEAAAMLAADFRTDEDTEMGVDAQMNMQ